MSTAEKKVKIRQIRGIAGRTERTRRTLNALGLGRVGKERELPANPAVMGQIARIKHLVTFEIL